jgi:hypothetical protein
VNLFFKKDGPMIIIGAGLGKRVLTIRIAYLMNQVDALIFYRLRLPIKRPGNENRISQIVVK